MYDYLREIPPGYKQEYKSLIDKFIPTNDSVKYQLIIMSYKEENFIGECVESLTNQTTSPDEFEVLIINNCSYEEEFDNTESVVKEKLERYKYDNIHSDKVGVIFGTGKTLNNFKETNISVRELCKKIAFIGKALNGKISISIIAFKIVITSLLTNPRVLFDIKFIFSLKKNL